MRRCIALMLPALAVAACATNPVSGKSELSLVSDSQEVAIGKEESAKVVQTIGEYPDPEAQALVRRIGLGMAAKSERPNLPWEFHLLNDEQVNAFALPGGYIFITRGIMAYMNDEAELASVIGHEIGHVTARHSAQQMTQQELAQVGLVTGMVLSPTVRDFSAQLQQGMQLMFLKFSRDHEAQADELGFRYMLNDGYDVRAAADMFSTLERVSGPAGQRLPEWASTHPAPEGRVRHALQRSDSLKTLGRSMQGATLGRDSYLQLLDGMMFGPDPRQGYFRNGTFYHPDLRFQVTFPAGWRTQNAPEGVLAAAPQQDAVMQLRIAGKGTAATDAARDFFGQQGLQSSGTNTDPINGLPAASGEFAAQLEDGTRVAGSAAFIEAGDYTYMLMGYGGTRSRNVAAIKPAIRSFRALTDPAYLDVQAATVRLMKVPRDMTVEQFNRQYPSSIDVTQVAVINGLDDASSSLKSGQLAKRVVGGLK